MADGDISKDMFDDVETLDGNHRKRMYDGLFEVAMTSIECGLRGWGEVVEKFPEEYRHEMMSAILMMEKWDDIISIIPSIGKMKGRGKEEMWGEARESLINSAMDDKEAPFANELGAMPARHALAVMQSIVADSCGDDIVEAIKAAAGLPEKHAARFWKMLEKTLVKDRFEQFGEDELAKSRGNIPEDVYNGLALAARRARTNEVLEGLENE